MRILWLSANILGYSVFPELLKIPDIDIVGIMTLSPNSISVMYDGIMAEKWRQWGIPVYEVTRIDDEENLISKISPDLILVCGWRQKIPASILFLPPQGVVGFHPTLLPLGRGSAPIINSILEGFVESGVTMFYLADDLDSGDIIGQEKFVISDEDYASDVYGKIVESTKKLIRKYIPEIASATASRIPQDHLKATFFPRRSLADNEINLKEDDPITIIRKIRAFSYPYRGAYIKISASGRKLIIWKATLEEDD